VTQQAKFAFAKKRETKFADEAVFLIELADHAVGVVNITWKTDKKKTMNNEAPH
jgi:hypothetical protein